MINVLITGVNGQLGNELKYISADYNFNFIYTDIEELNITDIKVLNTYFENNKIDYLVNCAAYTAVDNAEDDKKNAFLLNQTAPKNLASTCKKHKIKLIHISTDYVFNGKNYIPYHENIPTNPNSVYGRSKLEGENEIIAIMEDYIIIRTAWLYSVFGHNFVKTMIRLGNERDELNVVFDQIGSPTNAEDLARTILDIIEKSKEDEKRFVSGIYNFSNEGVCSWYDFAIEIHKKAEVRCKVKPVTSEEYPTPAKRPNYSVLDKTKIKNTFGIEIPHWSDSLTKCIDRIFK